MRKKRILPLIPLILLTLCISCNKTDLTPAYIEITYEDVNNCVDVSHFNETHDLNFDAEHLAALQQHTFTHVNVYVNNKNLGCWPLPCKVPVLDVSGVDSASVVVLPCFRKTGMSNTVQGYPFFNVLRKKALLRRGETYRIADHPLSYIYSPYVTIPYIETFANSSSFLPADTANNNISFQPTVADGRNVGHLVLNDQNGLSFDVRSINITLPVYNYYVYLEVTYKCESNIDVGLKISTGTYANTVHQLGGIYATEGEWKTIYFDLSSVIMGYHATSGSTTEANIVLTGVGTAGKNTNFYIDNIKVIYEPSA